MVLFAIYIFKFAVLKLNFRDYNFTIKILNGNARIFDIIRKKYYKVTPEEWVRQHVIHFLIHEIKIPLGCIAVEKSIFFNGLTKRFDIVSFDSNGDVLLLIECKAPHIKITEKTLSQAGIYQKTLKAKYTLITNGLQHIYLKYDNIDQKHVFIEELPSYQFMIQEL
jgi:hypothetical protein